MQKGEEKMCRVISYANCQEQIENKLESSQKAKKYSIHNRENYSGL